MGLRDKVKKGLKATRTAATSLDEAGAAFGRTLVKGVKKDIARKGSAGQRFADAPLGQYYLPKKAQTALGFIAPSPRKIGRDVKNVVRNPSPGNIAANVNNLVSVATLPLAGAGAIRGAKAATRGARAATIAGRALRGGEAGGVIQKFPLRGSAISRIKGRVVNAINEDAARHAERVVSRNPKIQALRAQIDALPKPRGGREAFDFTGSTLQKTARVKDELSRLGAAEALHARAPTSLRNLSNIRDKVTGRPKGPALLRVLKEGEEGFARVPGKSREIIAQAMKAGEKSPTKLAKAAGVSVNRAQQLRTDIGLKTKRGIAETLARGAMKGEEGWIRMSRKSLSQGHGLSQLGAEDFTAIFGPGSTPKAFRGGFPTSKRIVERVLSTKGLPGANKVPVAKMTGTIERGVANIQSLDRAGKYNVLKSKEIEAITRFAKAKGAREVTFRAAGETSVGVGELGKPIGEGAARHKLFGKAIAEKGMANLRAGFLKGEEGFMRLPGGKGDKGAREVVRRANLKATRQQLKETVRGLQFDLSLETNKSVDAAVAGLHAATQGRSPQIVKMLSALAKKEKRARSALKSVGVEAGRVERQTGSIIDIEGRMPMRAALQRFAHADKSSLEQVSGLPKMQRVHPGRMPRN